MNAEKWILFFEHDSKYQACTIKMNGKIDSLNVTAATSIILFERQRQLSS